MVLDYGSMSSASMHAQNVGWVSQRELAFTVPLQRWRMENGQLVFKDWACVSPFIFVDDEVSLTTGREVYGWPKVEGRMEASLPLWDRHPRSPTRLLTFATHVFPKVYAGEPESMRTLLQIDADPDPSYTELPPDPANPWAAWSALGQAARSSLSLMGNALDMALAMRARGYRTNRSLPAIKAMGGRAAELLAHLGPAFLGRSPDRGGAGDPTGRGQPPLAFDNITVKQFRDAQQPDRACYKALVRSTMGVERINRSGLLGDTHLLRGDPSGGLTVRVHRHASQPIIDSLGLAVSATQTGDDGIHVALLKPVFPFWTDVDLFYGAGEVICSRTHTPDDGLRDDWLDEQPDAQRAAPGDPAPAVPNDDDDGHSQYNTALGAATQPVAGPFHFPDVTLQVYPLLADRQRLDQFVQHYLNEPLQSSGMRFETMGAYAYLMVQVTGNQSGTMWSSSNDIGWWADREVSFCLPVKWYRRDADGKEELVGVAMVAPFVFSNNGRAVISDREVNGRPSVKADITSPQDPWLGNSGPNQPRRYLQLSTEVFPALGYGAKAEPRTLLEIDADDVLAWEDSVGWRLVGEHWGPLLVRDLARKHGVARQQADEVAAAKALALEVLAHGAPVNWLVLKQYRDAAEMNQACYQALVHTRRSVSRITDLREIEDRVHLRLHRYPGYPIVDALGLKVKSVDSRGGGVVQNLQPLRPFWMRLAVKEDLGTLVAVRQPDGGWHLPAGGMPPGFSAPGLTRVSREWQLDPQRLHAQARDLLQQALASSLEGARGELMSRTEDKRRAFQQTVAAGGDAVAAAALAQLLAADPVAAWADTRSPHDLQGLEAALRKAGLHWQPDDARLQRLTREQAAAAIVALDEVQVVVDAILSAEWEHWGNPRWYRKLPAKPDVCVPVNSLGGGLKELQAHAPSDAVLEATDDGAWAHLAD
jgi:hypothetical protein